MARNEQSNSVPEAKTTNRRLAARMKPAAGGPDLRDLGGDTRTFNPTAAAGELTASKLERGECVASVPLTFVWCNGHDSPSPRQAHFRRCYGETERLEVAETRKRGACDRCRASRTKCKHDPSKISNYPIQSHELFALGLTTPSLDANRDKHKHVMEEKIAQIHNTLVKAQENKSEQNGEASADEKAKAAAKEVTQSPPDLVTPKNLPSQKPKQPPKVYHQQARSQSASFKRGLISFKLEENPKRQRGNPTKPKKDTSTVTTNGALSMKNKMRKNACGVPIVCQERSIDSVMTTAPITRTSVTTGPAQVLIEIHETVASCPTLTHSKEQYGCTFFQGPITSPRLRTLAAAPSKISPERMITRRLSGSSDQGSHATTPVLSYGRSLSPSSENTSSEPRAYVHLSDVERIPFDFEPFEIESYEKFLHGEDIPSSDSLTDSTLSVPESANSRSLANHTVISEDETLDL